jgi:large subunit ribosomal protein L18
MYRKYRNDKQKKRSARKARVGRSIRGSRQPRLTVFRSAKHIYAQLIDPETGRTIGSVSTRSGTVMADVSATGNVEAAKRVGQAVAELARQNQIERVVFNRNGFLYHGRVKALAEAAREAGLQF